MKIITGLFLLASFNVMGQLPVYVENTTYIDSEILVDTSAVGRFSIREGSDPSLHPAFQGYALLCSKRGNDLLPSFQNNQNFNLPGYSLQNDLGIKTINSSTITQMICIFGDCSESREFVCKSMLVNKNPNYRFVQNTYVVNTDDCASAYSSLVSFIKHKPEYNVLTIKKMGLHGNRRRGFKCKMLTTEIGSY